jgi:hypothetical protein
LKRYVLMLAVMALLMVALAMPAFAVAPQKTVPGLPEQGTDHANSICSFSGLNDEPLDPEEGGLVQSYGQIVAAGFLDPTDKTTMERPGVLCNAHTHPYPEAFPPPAP